MGAQARLFCRENGERNHSMNGSFNSIHVHNKHCKVLTGSTAVVVWWCLMGFCATVIPQNAASAANAQCFMAFAQAASLLILCHLGARVVSMYLLFGPMYIHIHIHRTPKQIQNNHCLDIHTSKMYKTSTPCTSSRPTFGAGFSSSSWFWNCPWCKRKAAAWSVTNSDRSWSDNQTDWLTIFHYDSMIFHVLCGYLLEFSRQRLTTLLLCFVTFFEAFRS